jgi:hypothetical protein
MSPSRATSLPSYLILLWTLQPICCTSSKVHMTSIRDKFQGRHHGTTANLNHAISPQSLAQLNSSSCGLVSVLISTALQHEFLLICKFFWCCSSSSHPFARFSRSWAISYVLSGFVLET